MLLASALGLRYAYAAAMPYDGGEFGIALLVRGELRDLRSVRLPRGGREEPRVAVLATCELSGGPTVRFGNTHLAADWHAQRPEQIRAAQAAELVRVLKVEASATGHPLFLVGDFNCDAKSIVPPSPSIRTREKQAKGRLAPACGTLPGRGRGRLARARPLHAQLRGAPARHIATVARRASSESFSSERLLW